VHDDEQIIRAAWRSVVAHGTATKHRARDDLLEAVLARHREPHRRYHTVTHVAWVVRHVDELAVAERIAGTAVLHLAAIYHDAVYNPRASDNEAVSAALARTVGNEVGWETADLDHVERLILATAGHAIIGGDRAAAVLLDADLAILGAEPSAYLAYVAGVRFEYAHVDDDGWRTGRAAVLQHFLDREHIYLTPAMRSAREHRARANLSAELAGLRDG